MKKNDILTPIGLVLAIGFIFFAIAQGKGGVGMFIDIPSFLITVGGSFAAVLITFDLDTVKRIPSALKMSIVSPSVNKVDLVDQFKELSKIIRKDGILAIEQQVAEMEDPFLKKGLELIVDGVDAESVKEILEIELNEKEKVYGSSSKIFKLWGSYAPAFGMVGTLIGLIQMLSDMGSPDDIASGMSTALITTLYGALFTNMIFNPIGFNIESKGEKEIEYLEMVVCGLQSIQNGDSVRAMEEKLITHLNEKDRKAYYENSSREVAESWLVRKKRMMK